LGGTTTNERYTLDPIDGRDTMIWSKDIAIEPCEKKSPRNRLHNQMHKVGVPLKSNTKRQKVHLQIFEVRHARS